MKKYNITVNGTAYAVEVEEMGGAAAPAAPAPAAAPAAPAPAAAPAAPAPAA
ncbi:MAG: acetyl-CoA carboxylase biotin carboxyl carrier protein subunit, partial [Bacillota bacterium]|nr:acetyl-CoA carboxylase biotin carboxyl carrier protein subunit [Bacillota bacterium]